MLFYFFLFCWQLPPIATDWWKLKKFLKITNFYFILQFLLYFLPLILFLGNFIIKTMKIIFYFFLLCKNPY